jgi:hypothetical protein
MAIQVEREAERGVSREASLAYVKKIDGMGTHGRSRTTLTWKSPVARVYWLNPHRNGRSRMGAVSAGPFAKWAIQHRACGFNPVPIRPKSTSPAPTGWQTGRQEAEAFRLWLSQYAGSGIGGLLETSSELVLAGGVELREQFLIAVDIDQDDLVAECQRPRGTVRALRPRGVPRSSDSVWGAAVAPRPRRPRRALPRGSQPSESRQ